MWDNAGLRSPAADRPVPAIRLLLCLLLPLLAPAAPAWDSVGHRLTAAAALEFMGADARGRLLEILAEHPRWRQDFLDPMPAAVARGDAARRARWLLGQAAFWPDIVRGLRGGERRRHHRAAWHYTDGAWIRGAARLQGNVYLDVPPRPDAPGVGGMFIETEEQAVNVATALDYNARVLADPGRGGAERAVALCWVLHLAGDIHQPLHTGSLYSRRLFEDGDRGGNGIPVDGGNLHARWDRALAGRSVDEQLPEVVRELTGLARPRVEGVASDWTEWLAESRLTLARRVYSPDILAEVRAAEAEGRAMEEVPLSAEYVGRMRDIARQRVALAGLRLAVWFENELPR